jgi:23S rRNA U2552 (ribose-2'-O)-methylase RlmE/FtsJ
MHHHVVGRGPLFCLQMQKARHNLQAILDPVIDLLQQQILFSPALLKSMLSGQAGPYFSVTTSDMKRNTQDLEEIAHLTLEHYNQHAAQFWQATRDHDVSQNIAALL